MSDRIVMVSEKPMENKKSNHYFQIDFLKALMIMLVIVDHTVPGDIRNGLGNSLWERISIPIFLIIMGLNVGMSLKRKENQSVQSLYSPKYLLHKVIRYFTPFVVAWIVSSLIGMLVFYDGSFTQMINFRFAPQEMWTKWQILMGIMPFYGPGNWFIPLVLQSIIFFPILYICYKKAPKLVLILSAIYGLGFQFIIYAMVGPTYNILSWDAFYTYMHNRMYLSLNFFAYFFPVVLGLWFSDGFSFPKPNSKLMNDQKNEKNLHKKRKFQRISMILIGVVIIAFILTLILIKGTTFNPGWVVLIFIILIWALLRFLIIGDLKEILRKFLPINLGLFVLAFGIMYYYNEHYAGDNAPLTSLTLKLLFFIGLFVIFISPIVIGFLFFKEERNWFIWGMALISASYLIMYQFFGLKFEFLYGDYQLFVYPYSALLILIGMRFLPQNPKNIFAKGITTIGKATFHILLTQIMILGIVEKVWGTHYFEGDLREEFVSLSAPESTYNLSVFIYLIIAWVVCIPVGVLWYLGENVLRKKIQKSIQTKKQLKSANKN
ncbi:MAG: acyltransferase family protein [Promethearchaeota archaeon]